MPGVSCPLPGITGHRRGTLDQSKMAHKRHWLCSDSVFPAPIEVLFEPIECCPGNFEVDLKRRELLTLVGGVAGLAAGGPSAAAKSIAADRRADGLGRRADPATQSLVATFRGALAKLLGWMEGSNLGIRIFAGGAVMELESRRSQRSWSICDQMRSWVRPRP